MIPHRFQRFLNICRCYSGAAGASCARPGASWWPPYEDVGMGSRRTPMAAPLRESPPRRNRKHRRENAENRMTPHRFQRFLVLCRCYSGAAGACCARPGASLWRPHDSFGMGSRWAPWSLRRKDFRPDAFGSIDGECWTSAHSVQFCRRPVRGGQHRSWWWRQVFGRRHAREPERWGTSDRSAGSGDVGTFVCFFSAHQ